MNITTSLETHYYLKNGMYVQTYFFINARHEPEKHTNVSEAYYEELNKESPFVQYKITGQGKHGFEVEVFHRLTLN